MPGLSQLKQFNSDLLNLGDEVKIRSARGEKPVTVPLPKNIPDVDDSNDFRLGMPQLSEEEQEQADALAAERERQANDFSDITGTAQETPAAVAEEVQAPVMPDVSDLFNPSPDIKLDDLDLSEFEEKKEPDPPPEPEETPIEDLGLDALLAGAENAMPEPQEETVEEIPVMEEAPVEPQRPRRPNPHAVHESLADLDMDMNSIMSARNKPKTDDFDISNSFKCR